MRKRGKAIVVPLPGYRVYVCQEEPWAADLGTQYPNCFIVRGKGMSHHGTYHDFMEKWEVDPWYKQLWKWAFRKKQPWPPSILRS